VYSVYCTCLFEMLSNYCANINDDDDNDDDDDEKCRCSNSSELGNRQYGNLFTNSFTKTLITTDSQHTVI